MKTLSSLISELEAMFPEGRISISHDTASLDEIIFHVRTGLVEPADGQELHTIAEIIEIMAD